ncbi:MAG: type II secretion system secretin GspD [Pseudomonadales bacterium]|nr:type II secretion system secretin GspD [Pseudomonadales bacterium]
MNIPMIKSIKELKVGLLVAALMLAPVSVFAETYTLNFKDTDIKDLIKFVADATGYTVIIDPKVKAKINVISSHAVNEDELYNLFLKVLQVHGYAAVRNGDVVRIIQDKKARTSSVPVLHGSQRINNPEFITQIIDLKNVNATKLIPVLRPLVPQQGHMAAYVDTNSIIVSDTADNVAKIRKIVESIDRSPHKDMEILRLKHASAEDTVRILTQILKPQAGDKKAAADAHALVADKRSNSIIINGTLQIRQKIKKLIKKLDTPLQTTGNAKVLYLRHASAKDLAPVLSKVSQNMAKMGGDGKAKGSASVKAASIEADEASNSLIITAQPDVMEGLTALIKRLDIAREMVMVEAIIVEVLNDNGKALGFDWMVAGEGKGFGGANTTGALGALGSNPDALTGTGNDQLEGLAAALSQVTGGYLGALDFSSGGNSFAAILTALESNGETNILSTPSLMTLDNNEASIVVGQEVPFVTGSYTSTGNSGSNPGNPFQTVERENVGITLNVTPHVNEGNDITLDITQIVSGIAQSSTPAGGIITNERKIETTVRVNNGDTIVLGGLLRDDVQEKVTKVPILGDIPLLGRLFKSSFTQVTKTNLMIFIRPTIVNSSAKSLEVTKKSYDDIRATQTSKMARGVDLFDDDVLQVLPEWEEQLKMIEEMQQMKSSSKMTLPPKAEETDASSGVDDVSKAEDIGALEG